MVAGKAQLVCPTDLRILPRLLAALLVSLALSTRAGAQSGATSSPALRDLTAEQWIADLDFLATELPQRHKNAFHALSREQFTTLVEETRERLKSCEPHEPPLLLSMLVSKLGDSHTMLDWRPMARGFHTLPLAFTILADGVVVVGTTAEHAAMANVELLTIDGTPVGEVIDRVAGVFPFENESWKIHRVRDYLPVAEILKTTRAASSLEKATLRVKLPDGTQQDIDVPFLPLASRPAIKMAAPEPVGPARLSLLPRDDHASFWFETVPESNCIYVRYDRCGDDRQKTVAQFSDELLERLKQDDWERIIFDLRRNSGGNSALLDPLIARLGEMDSFKNRGRMVLLIGRATFSSGLMNAWRLREATNAICIGLPSGQPPNHFGEIKKFELPNSKLTVYYSTKRFELDPQNRPAMLPDVEIGMTIADYRAARDPALERAIEWKP